MKLVVQKAVLGAAATMLQKVINPKSVLPLLADILCEVKDNEMTLTASDAEVTLRTTIPLLEMEGDGMFCVPAGELTAALAQLLDQPLTIYATTDNTMRIEHSTGDFYFPLDSADEYPMPMANEYGKDMTIDGALLLDALKRSLWATSTDDLRPVMNGVYFELKDGWLDIVCSDGHSLVKSHIDAHQNDVSESQSMIINRKAANMLCNLLTGGSVEVRMSEREGEIKSNDYTLSFRLIEGKYPNYNAVIPSQQSKQAVIPRAIIINSVRKVQPFANCSSNMVRLKFEENKLTLQGEDIDFSKGAKDTLPIEYTDGAIEIGVKGSMLLTILAHLPGQELDFMMTDLDSAITLQPTDQPENVEVTMLAMPMMITND